MTREEIKKRYIIKGKGETIECFNRNDCRVYNSSTGIIVITNFNEFDDVIMMDRETLKHIVQQVL